MWVIINFYYFASCHFTYNQIINPLRERFCLLGFTLVVLMSVPMNSTQLVFRRLFVHNDDNDSSRFTEYCVRSCPQQQPCANPRLFLRPKDFKLFSLPQNAHFGANLNFLMLQFHPVFFIFQTSSFLLLCPSFINCLNRRVWEDSCYPHVMVFPGP